MQVEQSRTYSSFATPVCCLEADDCTTAAHLNPPASFDALLNSIFTNCLLFATRLLSPTLRDKRLHFEIGAPISCVSAVRHHTSREWFETSETFEFSGSGVVCGLFEVRRCQMAFLMVAGEYLGSPLG